jgi:hypothetical protein
MTHANTRVFAASKELLLYVVVDSVQIEAHALIKIQCHGASLL